jgi:hypothetical protein
MIYEHRTYTILPGKTAEFVEAFGRIPAPLFEKYGAKIIGVWTTDIGGASNEVVYILAFQDLAQREQVFQQFRADPEYQNYRKEGVRVESIASKILRPTDYSALQ